MKKIIRVVISIFFVVILCFICIKIYQNKTKVTKPTLNLTIYTLSSDDTEKWDKVKKITTEDATYDLNVKREDSEDSVFKHLVDEGSTSIGYGVTNDTVEEYNRNLGDDITDSKNNKLIGIKYLPLSGDNKGFVVADFDYGDDETNMQKQQNEDFYKNIYKLSGVN